MCALVSRRRGMLPPGTVTETPTPTAPREWIWRHTRRRRQSWERCPAMWTAIAPQWAYDDSMPDESPLSPRASPPTNTNMSSHNAADTNTSVTATDTARMLTFWNFDNGDEFIRYSNIISDYMGESKLEWCFICGGYFKSLQTCNECGSGGCDDCMGRHVPHHEEECTDTPPPKRPVDFNLRRNVRHIFDGAAGTDFFECPGCNRVYPETESVEVYDMDEPICAMCEDRCY